MKLVYLAGPYLPKAEGFGAALGEWRQNVRRADEAGRALCRAGYAVIVPHKNTYGWDDEEGLDWHDFLTMDEAIIERCDIVALLPRWEQSRGSLREKAFAERKGIRVVVFAEWDFEGEEPD